MGFNLGFKGLKVVGA